MRRHAIKLCGQGVRLLLLGFTLVSTGCLVIPVKESQVTAGRKIETKETTEWRIGETKRAEVVHKFGSPYAEFPDLNVIAYQWTVVAAIMPWVIAGGYNAAGGVEALTQEHFLLVGFDENERVAKFEVVHHNFGSLQKQVQRWAAAMTARGARIGRGAKIVADSERVALLYVYRPGGWSEMINTFTLRILLDGKLAAELNRHSFARLSVLPGSHSIGGWMRAYPSDAVDTIAFTACTNETTYLEAKVKSGTGTTTLQFRVVAPEVGQEAIRKMKNVGVPLTNLP